MKSILFFLLIPMVSVFSQERFEVKNLGFSIQSPQNWLKMEDEQVLDNIKKFDFTKRQFNELMQSNIDGVNLVVYTKYDPKKYAGIIPTIKVRAIKTNSKSIQHLLKSVEMSNENNKKALDNFEFSEKPTIFKISKNDAVAFSVNFKLKNGAKEYKIKSQSYYILRRGYVITLNFIEEIGREDNSDLFKTLTESIILEN